MINFIAGISLILVRYKKTSAKEAELLAKTGTGNNQTKKLVSQPLIDGNSMLKNYGNN